MIVSVLAILLCMQCEGVVAADPTTVDDDDWVIVNPDSQHGNELPVNSGKSFYVDVGTDPQGIHRLNVKVGVDKKPLKLWFSTQ
jgi:hypothetical protein